MPNKKKGSEREYRYKGKFISEELKQLFEGIAQESGKDLQKILDDKSLQPYLDKVIDEFTITWYRDAKQIINTAKEYKKSSVYFTDGDEEVKVPVNKAIEYLSRLEGKMYDQKDLIFVRYKTEQTMDGKMIVHVPIVSKKKRGQDQEEYDEYLEEKFGEFFESDDVMYMEYPDDGDDKPILYNPTS